MATPPPNVTSSATEAIFTQPEAESSASAIAAHSTDSTKVTNGANPRLRYVKPYWWPYKTFVKQRWIGRQLLEVVCTEFRDRSVEYYRHALESGVTRVNGVTAWPELVLRNGDRIDNTVHRHEPPVTNDPIRILHIDRERNFVVISKPGSLPVHATGRYFRNTILEIMKSDFGIEAFAVNRLDRLTSGLMIMALTSQASRHLADEFKHGKVRKEYVARVKGKFPEDELEVDQPLLTVDRQMGLVIVTPEGKEARTIFKRMSYDEKRDQSVVHCRPMTGRTHQLRVHLQYLGYPIANDPLYSFPNVWGPKLGKGGVELVENTGESLRDAALASRMSNPPVPRGPLSDEDRLNGNEAVPDEEGLMVSNSKRADREFQNIDLTSPIRLSQQAREIIAKLRRMRDEQEDWIKWKEVVFKAKEAQEIFDADHPSPILHKVTERRNIPHPKTVQSREKAALPEALPEETISPLQKPEYLPEGFCPDCFIPVPDDPDPEKLFIYLHALRYTTEALGTWETPLPRWAAEEWDGDWRGTVDEKVV